MQDVTFSAGRAAAITPTDGSGSFSFGTTPPNPSFARRLYVGGAGDVTLVTLDGQTILYKAVPVGTYLHVNTINVNLTGTSASHLVAEY